MDGIDFASYVNDNVAYVTGYDIEDSAKFAKFVKVSFLMFSGQPNESWPKEISFISSTNDGVNLKNGNQIMANINSNLGEGGNFTPPPLPQLVFP